MFTHKSIIWLLLVTVTEVPPTVRLGMLLAPLIFAHRYARTGAHLFESKWYVFVVSTSSMMLSSIRVKLLDPFNLVRPRSYNWGRSLTSYTSYNRCSRFHL